MIVQLGQNISKGRLSMNKRTKWEQWYVRYLIKEPFLFYIFLISGVVLFFALSLKIRMENGESLLWQIFVNVGNSLWEKRWTTLLQSNFCRYIWKSIWVISCASTWVGFLTPYCLWLCLYYLELWLTGLYTNIIWHYFSN